MSEEVKITIHLSQEAVDMVLQQGYATRHTLDKFLNELIPDVQEQQNGAEDLSASLEAWRRLTDEAEQLFSAETDEWE
jgi:hypothetical protein